MQGLSGKTAIITGASRGIGRATARRMAELGVAVVLAARSGGAVETIAKEISDAGGKAIGIACDVSRHDQVKATVELAEREFGSVDILVNNAGLIGPIARLEASDPAQWAEVINVNVTGVYNGIQAALPQMKAQGAGVIINISSGAANFPLEGWSHYCSSKAAAVMLTRCTHREEAGNGVRVVGLSPGTVATDMQVAVKASGINPVSQLDPSSHFPPETVAEAICWLATSAAKEFDGDDVSLEAIRRRMRLV